MGTRNLICIKSGGEYKVAKYCQWDGYPSGQGVVVLEACKTLDMLVLREKLNLVKDITDEEFKQLQQGLGIHTEDGMITFEQGAVMERAIPTLYRTMGGEIIEYIYKAERPVPIQNYIKFAQESLFCEWAYVVDLDKMMLLVYKGFNKQPLDESEEFYSGPNTPVLPGYREGYTNEYYPIKLAAKWALTALPSERDFINTLCPPEGEDDE